LVCEELYDLKNDPYETVNLIGSSKFEQLHHELKKQLENWIEISLDKGFQRDSEAIIRHFQQYGLITFEKRLESIQRLKASVENHFD
jgi:hypothetical protein